MRNHQLQEEFASLLAESGRSLADLTPLDGLNLFLRLFENHPDWGCVTCDWCKVSEYGPEEYGFEVEWNHKDTDETRTYSPRLYLAFKIGPDPIEDGLSGRVRQCCELEDLAPFREAVVNLPASRRYGCSPAIAVALYDSDTYDCALFDWWGVRDPERPKVSMTPAEWEQSNDIALMLRWFRQEWRGAEADLNRLLRRYCLACARRIWPLLIFDESKEGVAVAERHLDGAASDEEHHMAQWNAEGAAFCFDYPTPADPYQQRIDAAIETLTQMPPAELAALIHPPQPEDDPSPRGLLTQAAFFVAYHAMCYPGRPVESIERYRRFLSAPLLREMVGSPPNHGDQPDSGQNSFGEGAPTCDNSSRQVTPKAELRTGDNA